MSSNTPTMHRSWLFAPADHERRRERAYACGADAVILDLEDAVAPAAKPAARAVAASRLDPARTPTYVRVNGSESPWWRDDLSAVVRPGLAGIVVPKVERPQELEALDQAIGQLEGARGLAPGRIVLIGLIETARGVVALDDIATACARLERLGFGVADYALDMGFEPSDGEEELAYIRARLTHVSRAARLAAPIDSVVVEFRDSSRFRDSAVRGRRMGLGGKLCIHPDQVPIANEVFAPGAAEIRQAEAVIAAFEAAAAAGSSAVALAGSFIDPPVVERARQLLARVRPR